MSRIMIWTNGTLLKLGWHVTESELEQRRQRAEAHAPGMRGSTRIVYRMTDSRYLMSCTP